MTRHDDHFGSNCIDIGVVEVPSDSFARESGESEHSGVLEFVIRSVEARFEGLDDGSNPLLSRIRPSDADDSSLTYGPGNVRIERLKVSLPYRVRTSWYRTPDPRMHAVSTLTPDAALGTVNGRLTFFLHGHSGKPSLRGAAVLSGETLPLERLVQRAEWDLIGGKPAVWAGVTRLNARVRLDFDIAFGTF